MNVVDLNVQPLLLSCSATQLAGGWLALVTAAALVAGPADSLRLLLVPGIAGGVPDGVLSQ